MFLLDRVQINTHSVVTLGWISRKENSYSIAELASQQPRGHDMETQKSTVLFHRPSLQDAIEYSDPVEEKENKAHQISKHLKRGPGRGY